MARWFLFLGLAVTLDHVCGKATPLMRSAPSFDNTGHQDVDMLRKTTVDGQPKGAIVYLYRRKSLDEMKQSLQSVCLHLVGAYPILVVHGFSVTQEEQEEISKYQTELAPNCLEPKRQLEWVKAPIHDPDSKFSLSDFQTGRVTPTHAHWSSPAYLDARPKKRKGHLYRLAQHAATRPKRKEAPPRHRHASPMRHRHASPFSLLQTESGATSGDYKSMIGFWLLDVFDIAHQRGFEYVMRLDTDSLLDGTPKEDPFKTLHNNDAAYGYRAFCYEAPGAEDVWEMMREHVAKEKIAPSFEGFKLDGSGPAPMVYTNFEVSNVSFFLRPDVRKFATEMLRGTQKFRLGDAVIRAFQLGLFAKQEQVIHLDSFRYRHGCDRWSWVINKTMDCAIEKGDPFVMDWQATDSQRFGTPIGHCYSSRLNETRRHMEESLMGGKTLRSPRASRRRAGKPKAKAPRR